MLRAPAKTKMRGRGGTNERICARREFSHERVVSWPRPLLSLQCFLSGKMETDTASCFLSASLSLALAVVACGIGNPLAYEIQKLLVEKIQLGRIPLHYESITLDVHYTDESSPFSNSPRPASQTKRTIPARSTAPRRRTIRQRTTMAKDPARRARTAWTRARPCGGRWIHQGRSLRTKAVAHPPKGKGLGR